LVTNMCSMMTFPLARGSRCSRLSIRTCPLRRIPPHSPTR
jgi:hypothetical protein